MARRRTGIGPEDFALKFLAVLLLVVVLGILGGNIFEQQADAYSAEVGKMDIQRARNTFSLLSGVGLANMSIQFANKYDRVQWGAGNLTFHADFFEGGSATVDLPERFSYSMTSFSGNKMCIRKSGLQYHIAGENCRVNGCSTGTCSALMSGGTPEYGYYCDNGAWTDRKFFRRYYTECNPQPTNFLEVNKFVCPDTVKQGETFSCVVEVSWRCEEQPGASGSFWVRMGKASSPGWTTEVYRDCTGNVNHGRWKIDLAKTTIGSHTVEADLRILNHGPPITATASEGVMIAP